MSGWIVTLPILVPLVSAVLLSALRAGRKQSAAAVLAGALNLLACALVLAVTARGDLPVAQIGGWPAPFGITLIADRLSGIMLAASSVIGMAGILYSVSARESEPRSDWYYPMIGVLFTGVNGAFVTGDLFNLYVWFEVLLIASFVLLITGEGKPQIRGAIPYVTINIITSVLLLSGVAGLYGLTGTLNLAELSLAIERSGGSGAILAVAMLLLAAFGMKAAMFPLFFAVPAAYPTPGVAVSAMFAGIMTKVGVYSMFRIFPLLFPKVLVDADGLLILLSSLTMLSGVLGALAQNEFRRILSFHIISQIGYMTLGLAFHSTAGFAAALFFVVHNILSKSSLFLVSGLTFRAQGSFRLDRLGGLAATQPVMSALFLVGALSLAGIPPLSGFWGKLLLAQAGFGAGRYAAVGVAITTSLFTLFSMMKIWNGAFWSPRAESRALPPDPLPVNRGPRALAYLPGFLLAALILVISLAPATLYDLTLGAAHQLIDPGPYREAVLGAEARP